MSGEEESGESGKASMLVASTSAHNQVNSRDGKGCVEMSIIVESENRSFLGPMDDRCEEVRRGLGQKRERWATTYTWRRMGWGWLKQLTHGEGRMNR